MLNFKGNVLLPLNLSLILLLFFYSLFPLLPSISFDFHNGQRIAQICILTACAILIISRSEIYIPSQEIIYSVITFIVLSFISSAISNYPYSSLMNSLHYVMLAVLSISLMNTKVSSKFYIALFAIHSSLIFVCVLNVIFSLIEQQPIKGHNIIMKFDNIRHFNHIQVLSLVLGLYVFNTVKYKFIVAISIISNLVILLISNSLAAFVCLIIMLILFIIFNLKEYVRLSASLFLVSSIFFSLIKYLEVSFTSKNPIMTDSGRIEMWIRSIPELPELILGNGPGNYSIRIGGTIYSHPHNSVMQLLNEHGIIATAIALYLIYLVVNKASLASNYNKLIITTLITTLTYSLFSGLAIMPLTQVIFCFLLSKVIKNNKKITFSNYLKVITISLSLVYFVSSMISASKLDGNTPKMAGPSFWSAGEKNLEGL